METERATNSSLSEEDALLFENADDLEFGETYTARNGPDNLTGSEDVTLDEEASLLGSISPSPKGVAEVEQCAELDRTANDSWHSEPDAINAENADGGFRTTVSHTTHPDEVVVDYEGDNDFVDLDADEEQLHSLDFNEIEKPPACSPSNAELHTSDINELSLANGSTKHDKPLKRPNSSNDELSANKKPIPTAPLIMVAEKDALGATTENSHKPITRRPIVWDFSSDTVKKDRSTNNKVQSEPNSIKRLSDDGSSLSASKKQRKRDRFGRDNGALAESARMVTSLPGTIRPPLRSLPESASRPRTIHINPNFRGTVQADPNIVLAWNRVEPSPAAALLTAALNTVSNERSAPADPNLSFNRMPGNYAGSSNQNKPNPQTQFTSNTPLATRVVNFAGPVNSTIMPPSPRSFTPHQQLWGPPNTIVGDKSVFLLNAGGRHVSPSNSFTQIKEINCRSVLSPAGAVHGHANSFQPHGMVASTLSYAAGMPSMMQQQQHRLSNMNMLFAGGGSGLLAHMVVPQHQQSAMPNFMPQQLNGFIAGHTTPAMVRMPHSGMMLQQQQQQQPFQNPMLLPAHQLQVGQFYGASNSAFNQRSFGAVPFRQPFSGFR